MSHPKQPLPGQLLPGNPSRFQRRTTHAGVIQGVQHNHAPVGQYFPQQPVSFLPSGNNVTSRGVPLVRSHTISPAEMRNLHKANPPMIQPPMPAKPPGRGQAPGFDSAPPNMPQSMNAFPPSPPSPPSEEDEIEPQNETNNPPLGGWGTPPTRGNVQNTMLSPPPPLPGPSSAPGDAMPTLTPPPSPMPLGGPRMGGSNPNGIPAPPMAPPTPGGNPGAIPNITPASPAAAQGLPSPLAMPGEDTMKSWNGVLGKAVGGAGNSTSTPPASSPQGGSATSPPAPQPSSTSTVGGGASNNTPTSGGASTSNTGQSNTGQNNTYTGSNPNQIRNYSFSNERVRRAAGNQNSGSSFDAKFSPNNTPRPQESQGQRPQQNQTPFGPSSSSSSQSSTSRPSAPTPSTPSPSSSSTPQGSPAPSAPPKATTAPKNPEKFSRQVGQQRGGSTGIGKEQTPGLPPKPNPFQEQGGIGGMRGAGAGLPSTSAAVIGFHAGGAANDATGGDLVAQMAQTALQATHRAGQAAQAPKQTGGAIKDSVADAFRNKHERAAAAQLRHQDRQKEWAEGTSTALAQMGGYHDRYDRAAAQHIDHQRENQKWNQGVGDAISRRDPSYQQPHEGYQDSFEYDQEAQTMNKALEQSITDLEAQLFPNALDQAMGLLEQDFSKGFGIPMKVAIGDDTNIYEDFYGTPYYAKAIELCAKLKELIAKRRALRPIKWEAGSKRDPDEKKRKKIDEDEKKCEVDILKLQAQAMRYKAAECRRNDKTQKSVQFEEDLGKAIPGNVDISKAWLHEDLRERLAVFSGTPFQAQSMEILAEEQEIEAKLYELADTNWNYGTVIDPDKNKRQTLREKLRDVQGKYFLLQKKCLLWQAKELRELDSTQKSLHKSIPAISELSQVAVPIFSERPEGQVTDSSHPYTVSSSTSFELEKAMQDLEKAMGDKLHPDTDNLAKLQETNNELAKMIDSMGGSDEGAAPAMGGEI